MGFTWRERPAQRQDVWQPALRDSQEIHMVGGMPKIRTAMIEGPYSVTGVSATPSRDRIFVCRPNSAAAAAEEASCAERIFTNLTRRAYRRPPAGDDVQAPLAFYRQDAAQCVRTSTSRICSRSEPHTPRVLPCASRRSGRVLCAMTRSSFGITMMYCPYAP